MCNSSLFVTPKEEYDETFINFHWPLLLL